MALTINYKITGSIDGSYIIIQATNPESNYIDEGIDIETDISGFEINFSYNGSAYSYDGTSNSVDAYKIITSGLKLFPSDYGLSIFNDGLYDFYQIVIYTSVANGDYESSKESVLYGITEQSALKFIFDTDWKNSYKDINIYFDNSLKVKSWLNNIKLSNDAGLLNEGYRILKSLQKAIL